MTHMHKRISLLFVAGILLAGAGCQQTAVTNTNTVAIEEEQNINTTPVNSPSANSSANANTSADTNTDTRPRGHIVNVTSSGFSPSTLTISAGDTVKWVNQTSSSVHVAPDNHPTHGRYRGIWDDAEQEITNGESYSHTFTTAGTFGYHDHNRSSREGSIIVK